MRGYLNLLDMLFMIEEPNGSICRRILDDNRKLFQTVQGSTHNHQNWPGGYYDHITEVMNYAVLLHWMNDLTGRRNVKLSHALLVLFLHDIEKPWSYELGPDGELQHTPGRRDEVSKVVFRQLKLADYGISLNEEQRNAMRYVHGELDDYSSQKRMMNELAAFCHICDIWIARGWHHYPLQENDPWGRRVRNFEKV